MSGNKWYDIRAQGSHLDVHINGVIGWEVDTIEVLNSIAGQKHESINMDIYSPGGSMHDGIAIYNALRGAAKKGTKVSADANTLVGSAASVIYMGADERRIPENSYIMIHDPWSSFRVIGNGQELRDQAEDIIELSEFIDERADKMASVYSDRTGLDAGEIRTWMKEEKYMDGQEAVDLGFATDLSSEIKLAALSKDYSSILHNIPSDLASNKIDVGQIQSERDYEKYLREAGVSKRHATALVSKAKSIYGGDPRKDEPELKNILASLQDLGKSFKR